jgi:hypothetical protein
MKPTSTGGPLVRRSASFPFQVAIVCWIDLLGYGAMLAEAGFNPLHGKASEALQRLRRFHQIVASHSFRLFPTLVMNDGAVAYRDLSLRSRGPTYDFLTRAWKLFKHIKEDENGHGFPGARAVLAVGFRMRGRRAGHDASASHFKSLMKRYQNGEIRAEQAMQEASRIRQSFDIIPQLQANFAFSKAFVAESSGTRNGLRGAKFFVDLTIFNATMPSWVVAEKTVEWSDERLHMSASFAPIIEFSQSKHASGGPLGIRDGLQIAQQLSQNPDVLAGLRAAQKSE